LSEALTSIHATIRVGREQPNLGKAHKLALADIEKKASEALATTTREMTIIQTYTNLQSCVREAVARVLSKPERCLRMHKGKDLAEAALELLDLVNKKGNTGMACAAAMDASLALWSELMSLASRLHTALTETINTGQDLIAQLDKTIKCIRGVTLVLTCGIIMVGVPVAVLTTLPAVTACLGLVVTVVGTGGVVQYITNKFKTIAKRSVGVHETTREQVSRQVEAASAVQDSLTTLMETVSENLKFESEFQLQLGKMVNNYKINADNDNDEFDLKAKARIAEVWRLFKDCTTYEEVIELCVELQRSEESEVLVSKFVEDERRFTALQVMIDKWSKSLEALQMASEALHAPQLLGKE